MARTWILEHVYTVTLTLEIPGMTLGESNATSWVMDNNCGKYYPDLTEG